MLQLFFVFWVSIEGDVKYIRFTRETSKENLMLAYGDNGSTDNKNSLPLTQVRSL